MEEQASGFLEIPERRKRKESIIRVWDLFVRISHWLTVIFFAIIYLKYRKFPIHAYAGELVMVLMMIRMVWGFFGSKAARFSSFWYSPKQLLEYSLQMIRGRACYYASHNPMGSWMALTLITLMLINGSLGLMLYSSGQQLGPLGTMVPEDWEDLLKGLHKSLGHITAAFVALHIIGVAWAARAHRENYVLAMITGHKRVPRNAEPAEIADYPAYPDEKIPARLRPAERWFNYRHPFMGTILLLVGVILVVSEITEAAVNINKYLVSY
jgi:cytochrome b